MESMESKTNIEIPQGLSAIQGEIYRALEQMVEKQLVTEAALAKKVRENAKICGKNKAGIGLKDMETVLEALEENGCQPRALHLNSSNEFMIKKEGEFKFLEADAKKRRQSSEKSMSIFTSGDLGAKKNSKGKQKVRTERRSMNVYGMEDDWEE